jgi:hypothetical protein
MLKKFKRLTTYLKFKIKHIKVNKIQKFKRQAHEPQIPQNQNTAHRRQKQNIPVFQLLLHPGPVEE